MTNKIYIVFVLALLFLGNNAFSQGCEGDMPSTANDSINGKQTNPIWVLTNPI